MDLNGLIQGLVNDKGADLASSLCTQLGISPELAQRFVPAALEKLSAVIGGGQLDIGSLLGGGDVSQLVEQADADGLASELGIDAAQAKEGLGALAPTLLDVVKGQGGAGLLDALGGDGGTGGVLGAAKKLGGLFKS